VRVAARGGWDEPESGEFSEHGRGEGQSAPKFARSVDVEGRHEGDDAGDAEEPAAGLRVEDFDREVYGRVPAEATRVTWEVTKTVNETMRRFWG